MNENHIGYQIGDFTLYMDDKTGLYGISDSDGTIIVEAEYNSKEEMELFSDEANQHGACQIELVSVEDGETYKNMMSDFNKL